MVKDLFQQKMCNPNLDIVCPFTTSQLFGEEKTFAALTPLLDVAGKSNLT
jgi:hypothetical protein